MRSSWSGSIGFSLISLPVKLGGAISDNDVKGHQYAPDGSRIKYKRVAESTGEEIAYSAIRTGYDAPDGGVVFLTDEDVSSAYGEVSREAKILLFTDAGQVPDIALSKPFLVQPGKGGDKGYALLALALERADKVAIVEIGIRQRKRLAVISPAGDGYLLMEQLEWAEDIRKPDFDAPAPDISAEEENLAVKLVESLSSDFDYPSMKDDSQAKINKLIAARAGREGQIAGVKPAETQEEQSSSLLATLTASIEEAKKERTLKLVSSQ